MRLDEGDGICRFAIMDKVRSLHLPGAQDGNPLRIRSFQDIYAGQKLYATLLRNHYSC